MNNRTLLPYILLLSCLLFCISTYAIEFGIPRTEANAQLLEKSLLKYYNAKQKGIYMRVKKSVYMLSLSEANKLVGFIRDTPVICDEKNDNLNKIKQKLEEVEKSCEACTISIIDYMMRGNNQKSIRLSETVVNNGVKKSNDNEESVSIIDSVVSIYNAKRKTLSITSLSDEPAMYFESPFINTYLLNPYFRYINPAKILPKNISIEKTKTGFNFLRCYDGCARASFSIYSESAILSEIEVFFPQNPKNIILNLACRRYLQADKNVLYYPSVIVSLMNYDNKENVTVAVVIVENFEIKDITNKELELSVPNDTEIISHMGEVDLN